MMLQDSFIYRFSFFLLRSHQHWALNNVCSHSFVLDRSRSCRWFIRHATADVEHLSGVRTESSLQPSSAHRVQEQPEFRNRAEKAWGWVCVGHVPLNSLSVYAYDGAVEVENLISYLESNHHHFRHSISNTFASNFGRLHSQTTMSGSKPRDIPNISNASDTALYHYSAWALGSHTARSCREEKLTERSPAARGSQQVSVEKKTFATYIVFNAKRNIMLSSREWKLLCLFFSFPHQTNARRSLGDWKSA